MMEIPEKPWIIFAAECWINLSKARRVDPANPEAGSSEEVAYSEALDGAFAMEGLSSRGNGSRREYGSREEQDRVLMRVMMTAVELALDRSN